MERECYAVLSDALDATPKPTRGGQDMKAKQLILELKELVKEYGER